MAAQENPQKKSTKNLILIIIVILAVACLCLLVVGMGGYFFFGEQIRDLFSGQVGRISLDKPGPDGSLSGSYQYYSVLGGQTVNFSVSAEGDAVFQVDDIPDSEKLIIDFTDEATASMTWNGITFDGLGPLTKEELAALENLMESDLAHGINIIPLDAACQGENKIDPKQVAALLYPLQMRFKYLITNREEEGMRLGSFSQCDYGESGENTAEFSSVIQLTPSAPVPVVIGYFPFDVDGAIENPLSQIPGAKTACLGTNPGGPALLGPSLVDGPETWVSTKVDEFGPCEAKCRGACGADCDLDNCSLTNELRCELDGSGQNTGYETKILIYDCGLHKGCIEHDACYDRCNVAFGCNSWGATACRHNWRGDFFGNPMQENCDQQAMIVEGFGNPILWMYGFGPKSSRETFEYTDKEYQKQYNPEKCPEPGAESQGLKETPENKPQNEQGSGEKETQENKTQFIWRQVNTEINPLNSQTQFVGGGADPGWFGEARFAGKSLTYVPTESSFTVHDKEVDHEYVYHDVTVTVNFESPPANVLPGESVSLIVNFSKGGEVNEGGSGILTQFWYTSDEIYVEPKIFSYAPWAENYDGVTSTKYVVNFPSEGSIDSFTITASLWNADACTVTWTYWLMESD